MPHFVFFGRAVAARLFVSTALLLASVLICDKLHAASGDAAQAEALSIGPTDRVMGDPNAPQTIIEYASLTCPHCRQFHIATLPQLKAAYIDTGKVKLVFRDFPLDRLALAGHMLARCAETPEKSLEMLGKLFETQSEWARSDDPIAALAEQAGMTTEQVEACLANEAVARTVLEQAKAGQDAFAISSTPTFIVNGEKVEGALPFEEFDRLLQREAR